MHQISENTQVLCVTHLPQIAAWSDHHLVAQKAERGGRTYSHVSVATAEDKVLEIAKMLAGSELTSTILANAKELVETTEKRKKPAAGKNPVPNK